MLNTLCFEKIWPMLKTVMCIEENIHILEGKQVSWKVYWKYCMSRENTERLLKMPMSLENSNVSWKITMTLERCVENSNVSWKF